MKSMEGRGGTVEDIFMSNIRMSKTLQAIRLSMNYGYRRGRSLEESVNNMSSEDNSRVVTSSVEKDTHDHSRGNGEAVKDGADNDGTPHFKNIHISDLVGEDVAEAGFLWGLDDSVIRNVTFSNVTIDSKFGFQCFHVTGTYESVSPSMERCFMN